MATVENINTAIFESLRQSRQLADFLRGQPKGGKWKIISDYVLDDGNKSNDVMTFTIFSSKIGDPIQVTLDKIAGAIPKDLKDVKHISGETICLLQDKNIFSISILFDKKPFRNIGKEYANKIIEWLVECAEKNIKSNIDVNQSNNIFKYAERSKAKSFKVPLFIYTLVLVSLVSALACHISAECDPKVIEWFSDRDAMVIHGNEVGSSLLHFIYFKLCCDLGYVPLFFVPIGIVFDDEAGKDGLWFDPLVRLPDYISGVLASMPVENNKIGPMKDKFKKGISAFCIDNQNVIIFQLKFSLIPKDMTVAVTPYTVEITSVPRLGYDVGQHLDI
jgi:hypothetical protein